MTPNTELTAHILEAVPITEEAFADFGTILEPLEDGTPFTEQEAMLDVSRGTPRFYLMRLDNNPPVFSGITRHVKTTQSLLSVDEGSWLLAVAPPRDLDDPAAVPLLDEIRAFVVPGNVAVLMKRGTWHSGPHFFETEKSFANLELADTNQVDHHTYRLDRELGVQVEMVTA